MKAAIDSFLDAGGKIEVLTSGPNQIEGIEGMEEERGLALFLEGGIFLGVLPPVASRSWHRCIADFAVLLVDHFKGLLCHSPA